MALTTILIPTRNRYDRISRLIPFLSKYLKQFDIRIVVLDGSTESECIYKSVELCSKCGIEFKHFDSNLDPNIDFFKRIYLGLQMVKTDIVSLLDDEDVISIHGLIKCVKFLTKNDDYSVVDGRYMNYSLSKGKLSFCRTYKSKSIEHDSQLERIWHSISTYKSPLFYAVHRTQILKTIFKELMEGGISILDTASAELLIQSISLAFGKRKVLSNFYIGRGCWGKPAYNLIDYKSLILGTASVDFSFAEIHHRNKIILLKYLKGVDEIKANQMLDCIFASYFLYITPFRLHNERKFYMLLEESC